MICCLHFICMFYFLLAVSQFSHITNFLNFRLVSGIKNAAIVDQFYDKSNWCIVLKKL